MGLSNFLLAVGLASFAGTGIAKTQKAYETTGAPYFVIPGNEEGGETMPLEKMEIDANVAGVIADVSIKQTFKNDGKKPIEAIYVFPASTRAAVYAMEMRIGERLVVANIKEREAARRNYEEAMQAGKTASLLEQQRPNVFQMSVANIMPGDRIEVDLRYTELVVPEERVYELVIPTVVGPRYHNAAHNEQGSTQWVRNPYLEEGKKAPYKLALKASLQAGMPIQTVTSPSHKIEVNYQGRDKASFELEEGHEGNRDFVLRYRLAGDKVDSGLLLYEGEDENFFLMMLEPPARLKSSDILSREYTFIVDVSGSMNGFPLDVAKELMLSLFKAVRENDYFNIVLFAGASQVLAETPLRATPDNLAKATAFLAKERGGGGTEVLEALRRALSLKKSPAKSRSIVIATDGYVSVEKEVYKLIRERLDGANFFAFGIGSSVNRHLIESMARAGQGEPYFVLHEEEAQNNAQGFHEYISAPVLTNIKFRTAGFQTSEVVPMEIPDLFAERPIIVFGKYSGKAKGSITVTGTTTEGAFTETFDLSRASASTKNKALKALWARKMIDFWSDEDTMSPNGEAKKNVTTLGLKYSLLTAYTSFVAIDSEVRNTTGDRSKVEQPLPLPQGVSNFALAGNSTGGSYGGSLRRKSHSGLMSAPMAKGGLQREADAPAEASDFGKKPGLGRHRGPDKALSEKVDRKEAQASFNLLLVAGLDPAALTAGLGNLMADLQRCVGRDGELEVVLTVNKAGKVTGVVLKQSFGKKVDRCLTRKLKTLNLPKLTGKEKDGKAEVIFYFRK